MAEAENIVKRSETVQPEFKNLTGALVVGPSGVEFPSLLETSCDNGFKCGNIRRFRQSGKMVIKPNQEVE